MRKLIVFLTVLIFSGCQAQEKKPSFIWNLDKERGHNENRNDTTTWSDKNWEADIQNMGLTGKPLVNGVFPVPDYDLVDSTFNGLGNAGDWEGFDLENRKVVYHSLYVTKNAVNEEFISNEPNEVFFTIAVLTDTIDTKRYSHTYVSVSSRNHPHYVGQGFVKTKSNKIDFISFISADRNAYAIVNMRLFDLRIGRIVMIAPKKDGTLRSLQLDAPVTSSDKMDRYVKDLLKNNKEVIEFFTEANSID